MFIGHIGAALAAKRVAPMVSAGALVAAAMLIDLVWPVLLLLDVERVEIVPALTAVNPLRFVYYPFSHSLLLVLGWAALAALLYWTMRHNRTAAIVIAALVASHWVLDFITHIPDLPLWPGDAPLVGLGLWNSLPGTLVVEGMLFVAGIWLYLTATRAADRTGSIAFWAFVVLLVVIHLAAIFGPVPPGAQAVAVSALALWLLPPWAHWFDRHRTTSGPDRNASS
jgi:hypothetical protein